MALTQDQWFKKLKSHVPTWVFENNVENRAIFMGLAKVMRQVQLDTEQHIAETYIDQATEEYVELHGEERAISRFSSESLPSYRQRIKRIVNNSNLPAIKALVDSLLLVGESTIIEHFDSSIVFLDRNAYFDRNIIDFEVLYNAFTILVDLQIVGPYSFLDRELYMDRDNFIGSIESSQEVFENIVQAVNKEKVYGTVYRIIERVS